MKTMLYSQLQKVALIAGACLVTAAAGTLLAQQFSKPKPVETPVLAGVATSFDRTTPIGALRDFDDALNRSDSNRVMRAMHVTTPAARSTAQAMAEAVETEREFKRVVTARFGSKRMKFINISFGQAFLYDEVVVQDAVQWTDADHAVVRLPSRSNPDKPHKVSLVRVDGVWKFPDTGVPGISDNPDETTAVFRKSAMWLAGISKEIESGKYQDYEEVTTELLRKVRGGQ